VFRFFSKIFPSFHAAPLVPDYLYHLSMHNSSTHFDHTPITLSLSLCLADANNDPTEWAQVEIEGDDLLMPDANAADDATSASSAAASATGAATDGKQDSAQQTAQYAHPILFKPYSLLFPSLLRLYPFSRPSLPFLLLSFLSFISCL
jgi:hypothetical protein